MADRPVLEILDDLARARTSKGGNLVDFWKLAFERDAVEARKLAHDVVRDDLIQLGLAKELKIEVDKETPDMAVVRRILTDVAASRGRNNTHWMNLIALAISLDAPRSADIIDRVFIGDDQGINAIAMELLGAEA